MEFCILGLAVVGILILFACSVTNFLKELPKCQLATRKKLDRTVVHMGYFIYLEKISRLLCSRINVLTALMQELEVSEPGSSWLKDYSCIQREAVRVSDEAGRIINCSWSRRRWSRYSYQLSSRVAEIISKVDIAVPQNWYLKYPKGDTVPGIVVLVLIVYALTNAVLHLKSSRTANSDVIDWIVLDMLYPFKFKNNLQRLRDRVIELNKRKPWFQQNPGHLHLEMRLGYNATLLEEAELLSEEVGDLVNYWYEGWTGSRFRFSKRAEQILTGLKPRSLKGGGSDSRKIIDFIDQTSQIFPEAITDIRRFVHFNAHNEVLKELIIDPLQHLQISAADAHILADEIKLMQAAKDEAIELIQQAECIDQHWYKMWPGTRYKLSKRLAKVTIYITKLQHDMESKLLRLHRQYQNPPQQ